MLDGLAFDIYFLMKIVRYLAPNVIAKFHENRYFMKNGLSV